MRVFKETQMFRQWWLWLVLGVTLIITTIPFFNLGLDRASNIWGLSGPILAFLIMLLFWIIKLETRIDSNGITAIFKPFRILRRHYKWVQIKKCYVRQYAPISEYGGWGIRGFGNAEAYNVSGNMGIQIVTIENKKFLIGTNKPEDAKKVIKYYQEN